MKDLYTFIVFIGLVFCTAAIIQYSSISRLKNNGVHNFAEVVEMIKTESSDGDVSYSALFRFPIKDNVYHTFKDEVSFDPHTYDVGDVAEIIYNPHNINEIKVYSFWGLYRWCLILIIIASPFLTIGIGYFIYSAYIDASSQ